jgi:Protein of unknown function (DUF1822)
MNNLTLDDMTFIYPDKLFLEFSQTERERVWLETQQQSYANGSGRWNAYINSLCLKVFCQYLQSEPNWESSPQVYPNSTDLPSLWQVVNGTAIDFNSSRCVLIPSCEKDFTELRVAREWIDLPDWAGNYYLAVQVNLEECWICVWGYATHQQLKQEGKYDRMDETYSLEAHELIEDLSVMWVAQSIYPRKKSDIEPLPHLSDSEAESLIAKLTQSFLYSPRLDLPFPQWGALIGQDKWRNELYQRAQKLLTKLEAVPSKKSVDLGAWFQNIFAAGWQSLDTLLNTESTNLGYSFRQGKSETINLSVKGVKLIDLGIELGARSVALLVGLTPEEKERLGIRVQLHPTVPETYLPPEIQLTLLSESGQVLQEIQARSRDNFIQLKRFTCPVGKQFIIKVSLDNFSLSESFLASLDEQKK